MSAGHSHSSAHYGNTDAVRAVVVSAVALGIAAMAEITASIASGSASVLSDGLHNAGDVLTSFILLLLSPSSAGLPPGDEITDAAESVSGVLQVHDVRVRWVGRELVAVMHVATDPKSTLEEAHALSMRVEDAVCHEVPAARLEIHMDPGTAHHHHAVVGTPLDHDQMEEEQ